MKKSQSYHFVFYRNCSSGIILLVVYVDDIVITGSNSKCKPLVSTYNLLVLKDGLER